MQAAWRTDSPLPSISVPRISAMRPSICSHSLGRAWNHDLKSKLEAATLAGYEGIELFYEDLEYVARDLPGNGTGAFSSSDTANDANHIEAAHLIRGWCDELHLEINCLQPFWNYEGLKDREAHRKQVQKLHLWLDLVKVLGTDTIAVPSTFLPKEDLTDEPEMVLADLAEMADIGLRQTPVVRFAYESLCWGTFCDRWEQAWEIVQGINKPNFGLCLDTFNITGRIYADPAAEDGKNRGADKDMRQSMQKLRQVDPSKIFFVQVVDAERLDEPIIPGHKLYDASLPKRMVWSRNCRLFPFEERAYLPVLDVLQAATEAGYTGWISFELFNRSMNEKGSEVPGEHARRGQVSYEKLCSHFGWESRSIKDPRRNCDTC